MEYINQDITAVLDKNNANLRVTVNILPSALFSVKVTDIFRDLFQCK